ncbi:MULTISPECIES: ShlB/FhaC/HecB family hemolysin secretion/activation protein [Achromobacter]|uniref:ShlB/FhaC/HecB family hemolysin secretion/activation protein n=1 Tax=Achromobacter denitrificans TaxID=32002 RepID=A0A6N0JHT4_ACHDE|nr:MULTISPECIES: ShlB/FhaC/HecB family hemolysin secretion/activation protein [Achromobacter]QCS65091.1 ShlB/FhaC/HecB family hemolysin secretion/activation protein [Achromobacter denitrificans]QKH42066.1 ShlB/FhaC/HecB family hemolysin secretion/activation protein [Achromobacter denitrificans]QKH50790.1 ShlB/FhaC/HecB family hemolysin secretion/activation protein [Achromobacter denitrificans]QKQ46597.1 ShlB/FhaC/HecB family hemolysin secretion/activation protein [Achromobacter denitrificans]
MKAMWRGLGGKAIWAIAGVIPLPALAQPLPEPAARASEIQRRQEQEIDAQRARAAERPDVLAPAAAPSDGLVFPAETPCFPIRVLSWEGAAPPPALAQAAGAVLNRCVGGRGLRALQEHLIGQLIDGGQVTARVVVPEQSLAAGTLTLRYLPGRISAVKGEGAVGWWRAALPRGPGNELNQRDLDQALENIRRLGSQADASIDIAPGPEPGDSDILIRPGTGKRWHGYVGGDNGGMDAIGKYQVNAGLTLDSPLFLYDQLSVAWNSNARWRDAESNTRAASINYSIPFGYWTVFAGASKSTYRQTVAGFDEPIVYGGTTKQVQAGVSVVPYRGTAYKGNLSFSVLRKRTDSTLNDVPIEVQRRDVTGYEFSYGHRHYLGQVVLDVGGGLRGTWPQYSDAPGYVYGDPDWNGRSTILAANAGLYAPFKLAGQSWAYQVNWQIQHAETAIVPADYFTIGNRYAVRGFDGQMTLASEDGWTLRNDLSLNLDALASLPGQQLYAGLDVGRVGGPSAAYLSGRTLVGAVAGLRGRLSLPYVNASYDFSAGWPLKKPESLKTASTVFAMALMFEF